MPRWCDRFGQHGIKVSFWASGTLKIVIYVENYPQKRCFRLADYHPLWGWGVLISGQYICTYHICTCRGLNSGRHYPFFRLYHATTPSFDQNRLAKCPRSCSIIYSASATITKTYNLVVWLRHVRDRPGTAANGQRSSGRGCSVCSSASRTLAFGKYGEKDEVLYIQRP